MQRRGFRRRSEKNMSGSTFGRMITITTWGESHGKALGAVIDGIPAGLELCEDDIQPYMDRRSPGRSEVSTARNESDSIVILSGTFKGVTTGTPISVMVRNNDQHSSDYDELSEIYRPGHADLTFEKKFGIRDHRGGGRSSGRETLSRVAAGAIASKMLKELGISVTAYTRSIGPVRVPDGVFDRDSIASTPVCMPDTKSAKEALEYIRKCSSDHDSTGGTIECIISGVPAGIGDPVFEKLDAEFARAVMSIGAVKAVEIGDGTAVAIKKGSENNDCFYNDGTAIKKKTNHSGGILGGISDGSDILIRASIKPTPSISQPQETVDKNGRHVSLEIKGRHDPVIVPRAVVVVESMCAITLLDAMMCNMSSRSSDLISFYKNKS